MKTFPPKMNPRSFALSTLRTNRNSLRNLNFVTKSISNTNLYMHFLTLANQVSIRGLLHDNDFLGFIEISRSELKQINRCGNSRYSPGVSIAGFSRFEPHLVCPLAPPGELKFNKVSVQPPCLSPTIVLHVPPGKKNHGFTLESCSHMSCDGTYCNYIFMDIKLSIV